MSEHRRGTDAEAKGRQCTGYDSIVYTISHCKWRIASIQLYILLEGCQLITAMHQLLPAVLSAPGLKMKMFFHKFKYSQLL